MKVLIINEVFGTTSVGKICSQLAEEYEKEGHEVKVAYGRWGKVPEKYKRFGIRIGTDFEVRMSAVQTRLLDNHGLTSKRATQKFIKWAEEYKPDLLWLHNLHGYYINYEILFQWIKKHPELEVKWTLHDCWSFTGHCVHFTVANCYKWKEQCSNCCQKKSYPASYFMDSSKANYKRKMNAFTGVKNMTIITPSKWLADLVSQSYLNEYKIMVVNNTIDTDVFKPTVSDFKKRFGIEDKIMVLAVSNTWNVPSKGLGDIYELANMLDERYAIVIVGLSDKLIKKMPHNVIGIKKTDSQEQLATIYTAADVFVNPSREETYGMTTAEAISCGTEAIVYKETACEEIVNAKGGVAIPQGARYLYQAITGETFNDTKGDDCNLHKKNQ